MRRRRNQLRSPWPTPGRGAALTAMLLAACDTTAPLDASDGSRDAPSDVRPDAGGADAGMPAVYPADPRVLNLEGCRLDQAAGWEAVVDPSCVGRASCIDAQGRIFRDGAPWIARGVYSGGREVDRLLDNCPPGGLCEMSQPASPAGYVDMLADAGFTLVLERVDALSPALKSALDAEPRVSIAHLLFGDPFTAAGHDLLAAEIDRFAPDPEVAFWMGPDEPDLNGTWPMATGLARLLRGSSPELDALLTGRYAPGGTPFLPVTEPAHDPLGRPFASAVVIDATGLAVASDVYDAILPVTYPFQEPYSRADDGEWSVLRQERFAVPGVPMLPVLQMVEIASLGLRRPSPEQIRAQIFSSLALGADGAFYFALTSDEPRFAGRAGWFAADDRPAWQAYSESHASWDALVPVLYSDATVTSGRHDVLLYRRFTRGGRRLLVIANPTPYDRPIDLDAIVLRQTGEAVRHYDTCAPFTERAQIVPGYATLVLEVVPAAVTEPMPGGDPLAGLRRARPSAETPRALEGAFQPVGALELRRSAHVAASVSGEIFVAGGYQMGTAPRNTFARGDGVSFALGPPLPFASASAAAGALGDVFVVAGGVPMLPTGPTASLADCARFRDGWSSCAPIGNGPVSAAAFARFGSELGGELFVLGGAIERDGGTVLTTNVVQRYVPSIDAWRAEAHLPGPRVSGAAMVSGGVVYLVGGTTVDGASGMGRQATEVTRYDLVERRFLAAGEGPPASDLPTPRQALSCAALEGYGYCVGGYSTGGDNVAAVERLDFTTGEWARLSDLPQALSETALVAHRGALYLLGGLTSSFDDSDVVYRLE